MSSERSTQSADERVGPDAARAQAVREPVGARVELARR